MCEGTNVYRVNLAPYNGRKGTVIAATRQEAVNRAVALLGQWASRDCRVQILGIEDIDPRECPHVAAGAVS